MNCISQILFKVLVKEFYRINAGFFLIVIGICFGFLRDVEHIALARYFTSSVYNMFIPIAAWLLYSLKIIAFNNLSLEKKENEFLYTAAALKPLNLWIQWFLVAAQQFLPAWLYGAFLMIMALQVRHIGVIATILSSLFILSTFISATLYRKINHPNPGINSNLFSRKLNSLWIRPFILIYPEWITRRQPVLVFGTKILACLMVIGISRLYLFDDYDERLLGMGCGLAFAFNLVIVFYYHRFENFHFTFLRNLPLPWYHRSAYFTSSWLLLILPEIGAIVNYFPGEIAFLHLFTILVFGISAGLLSYSSLFIKDISLETFLRNVFVATFLWIILILFKVPLVVLALIQIGMALVIYRKYFYRFEFNSEINSEK